MPDLPEEAVEAAAKADYVHRIGRNWADASDFDQITWLGRMRAALAAAYPHLRQQIAREIAANIRSVSFDRCDDVYSARDYCAVVAEFGAPAHLARGAAQPGGEQ